MPISRTSSETSEASSKLSGRIPAATDCPGWAPAARWRASSVRRTSPIGRWTVLPAGVARGVMSATGEGGGCEVQGGRADDPRDEEVHRMVVELAGRANLLERT